MLRRLKPKSYHDELDGDRPPGSQRGEPPGWVTLKGPGGGWLPILAVGMGLVILGLRQVLTGDGFYVILALGGVVMVGYGIYKKVTPDVRCLVCGHVTDRLHRDSHMRQWHQAGPLALASQHFPVAPPPSGASRWYREPGEARGQSGGSESNHRAK